LFERGHACGYHAIEAHSWTPCLVAVNALVKRTLPQSKQGVHNYTNITVLAVIADLHPKKGRRTVEQAVREHAEDFQEGQRFRAGVEGSISVLKRAFKLNRCLFKGFKNFAASVGCAVFCHNLVLLARL
jgi:hypothetical protein